MVKTIYEKLEKTIKTQEDWFYPNANITNSIKVCLESSIYAVSGKHPTLRISIVLSAKNGITMIKTKFFKNSNDDFWDYYENAKQELTEIQDYITQEELLKKGFKFF